MGKGKRYDGEVKLNKKKVIATIIAIIVIIMVIISLKNLFSGNKTVTEMTVPTSYFTVYDNGKYGVIDNKGNTIIDLNYDEMIIIPDKSKDLFICYENIDYQNETYSTKVVNANGEEVLTNYSNIRPIEKSDLNGVWYDNNLLIYESNGLYGLIDFEGNKVLEAEYTNIESLEGTEKSIVVEKNGLKGIVNSNLKDLVVECKFEAIETLSLNSEDDGYIVLLNGKYGIVSASGKTILENNYQEIKNVTGNSMYVIRDDSGLKLIDSNLNTVLANGFEDIVSINGENLIIKNGDLYGVIKTSGESKVPVEYEDLSYATDNYYVAKKGGLYGIISIENVVCVDFKYNSLEYLHSTDFYQAENSDFTTDIIDRNFETKLSHIIISELNIEGNYMQVRENGEYKYYNLNIVEETNINALKTNTLFLSKNGDKYGYVNKDGELIVDYKYDDAREQNSYGYCAVKQNGLWGVLDSSGNVILEPSVNLDDNLYIEFISTWHLYDDLSLNIYVK